MAINSRPFVRAALALILLGLAQFLYAQSAGYYIDTRGSEPRFFQRLAWSGGEYALRYQVIIQREVNGTYQNHLSEFTSDFYIDVSLPPGQYRFRVISYDVLNRPGEGTEWFNIEVRRALKPELLHAIPVYTPTYIEDGRLGYVIDILGNNLIPESEFIMRGQDGAVVIPEADISDDGSSVRFFIESSTVIPGEYEIIARNPGGLETGMGPVALHMTEPQPVTELAVEPQPQPEPERPAEIVQEPEPEPEPEPYFELVQEIEKEPEEKSKRVSIFTLKPLKPVMFRLGIGVCGPFRIHNENSSAYDSHILSLDFQFSTIFALPLDIYLGPELSMSLWMSDRGVYRNEISLNLLTMKWFANQRFAFGFRAGALYTIDFPYIGVSTGISIHWRIFTVFLLNVGVDYVHQLNYESSSDDYSYVRLLVGFSFQF